MVPALVRYINAIKMLASIFTELADNTADIGTRLEIQENLKSDDANRAKRLFKKMKTFSKELGN